MSIPVTIKFLNHIIFAVAFFLAAGITYGEAEDSRFSVTGDETEPPQGYYDFCMEHLNICDNEDRVPQDIKLTHENLQKLVTINSEINDQIAQVSDAQHYGKHEYWSLPMDGKGDCEDISIFKRLMMIKAGFPIQALLLTQVITPKEGNHIVLTIKTDKGDFIADNLVDELKIWHEVPYKFVRRQSQYQQNVWVKIISANFNIGLTKDEIAQINLTGKINKHLSLLEDLKDKSNY